MAQATLVFMNGTATGATEFAAVLDALLTNPFQSTASPPPGRGLGWSSFFSDGYDKFYFSLGSSQSERIYLRLIPSMDDTYIDRTICQYARSSDGYMLNSMGDTTTKITVGSDLFEFWIIGNQNFIHIVTFVGTTYSHYYSGLINRFAPYQNSSIYGLSAPMPTNTTTPTAVFTIATNTTLFLRTGLDIYGGYDAASNLSFVAGQKLYIIDQSLESSTINHQGVVVLNSVDTILNTINVSYSSGDNTFSSFAIISVDPQPVTLNSNGTIRGNIFLMLDDFIGEVSPQFNAVNEFTPCTGLPPESIQNPDVRGVYITYPIRLFNTQEIRGTLFGIIDTPNGVPGARDFFQTFDGLFRFINFPDGTTNMLAIGSVI